MSKLRYMNDGVVVREAEKFFRYRCRIEDPNNLKDEYNYDTRICLDEHESLFVDLPNDDPSAKIGVLLMAHAIKHMPFPLKSEIFELFGITLIDVENFLKAHPLVIRKHFFDLRSCEQEGSYLYMDKAVMERVKELYDKHLWHKDLRDIPQGNELLFLRVDVPGVFTGESAGRFGRKSGKFLLFLPSDVKYSDIPNWPKREHNEVSSGELLAPEIEVNPLHVLAWRLLK